MKKIFCWIGFHDDELTEVGQLPSTFHYGGPGLTIQLVGRKLYDRKCKRCGREVKAK